MWPFQRKQHPSPAETPAVVELPPQQPDDPRGFGFKNTWWAIPSADTAAIVDTIGLQNAQPANWQTGIRYAYEDSVFVTPPIKNWTLITGFQLPPSGQNARDEVLQPLLELSETFSTALVFSTHRIVGYHVWAKAVAGTLIRGYGYLGESGQTLWDEGALTPEEVELEFAFFDERCYEAGDDSYWEREDLTFADEMNVMDIARLWSVSPDDLEVYKPKERSLGVLGSHSKLLRRVNARSN